MTLNPCIHSQEVDIKVMNLNNTCFRLFCYSLHDIIHFFTVTTIQPQLGILSHDTDQPIRIADLPGLVEGAHANVGMGHRFLRHIERTRVLLFVVDIGGFQLSSKHPKREAWEMVNLLAEELELYQAGLSLRPAVLAINKMDTEGASERLKVFQKHLTRCRMRFRATVAVSALHNTGVNQLKTMILDSMQTVNT